MLYEPSVPSCSSFANVNPLIKVRPCEVRLVSFICSASYQEFPKGDQFALMVENCGNGRKLCATVVLSGKPAYRGVLKPRDAARAESIREVSSVWSAALLLFSPKDAMRCGVSAFRLFMLLPESQTARLPT